MKGAEDLHNLAVPHWFIGVTSASRLTLDTITDETLTVTMQLFMPHSKEQHTNH